MKKSDMTKPTIALQLFSVLLLIAILPWALAGFLAFYVKTGFVIGFEFGRGLADKFRNA